MKKADDFERDGKTPKFVRAHRAGQLLLLATLGLALLSFYLQGRDSPLRLQAAGLMLLTAMGSLTAELCTVCPHCGAPLCPTAFGGVWAWIYMVFHPLPKRCPRCGKEIRKKKEK